MAMRMATAIVMDMGVAGATEGLVVLVAVDMDGVIGTVRLINNNTTCNNITLTQTSITIHVEIPGSIRHEAALEVAAAAVVDMLVATRSCMVSAQVGAVEEQVATV